MQNPTWIWESSTPTGRMFGSSAYAATYHERTALQYVMALKSPNQSKSGEVFDGVRIYKALVVYHNDHG